MEEEGELEELNIAMYNVIEDPEETKELHHQFPELKKNFLKHIRNIVSEDFPSTDFSGHPSNFNGQSWMVLAEITVIL